MAPGRVQFELGYTFTQAGDSDEHAFGELLVRIGVASWLEGRLGLNSLELIRQPAEDQTGLQDVSMGIKALLHRRAEGSSALAPQIALIAGVDLPTGTGGSSTEGWQPGALLAFAFDFTERWSLGSNVGWAYLWTEDGWYGEGVASIALGYDLPGPFAVYLEGYGLLPEERGGDPGFYLDSGVAWLLSPNVQLDGRVGVGLQEPTPNMFAGAGLSFRL